MLNCIYCTFSKEKKYLLRIIFMSFERIRDYFSRAPVAWRSQTFALGKQFYAKYNVAGAFGLRDARRDGQFQEKRPGSRERIVDKQRPIRGF